MERLNSREIRKITHQPVESISRAGRNDATQMKRQAGQKPKASPRSYNTKPSQPSDISVTADVLEAEPFGMGAAHDSGKREEICSSPRSHPEIEKRLAAAHETSRRAVFAQILKEVPSLRLVDEAMVTDETRDQVEHVALTPRKRQASGAAAGSLPPIPSLSAQEGALTARAENAVPEPPSKPTTGGTVQSARGLNQQKEKESASFLSPVRWKPPKRIQHPDVGHYRPKFAAVEHAMDRLTKIIPLPSPRNTREAEILRRRDQHTQEYRERAEKALKRKEEILRKQEEETEKMRHAQLNQDARAEDDDMFSDDDRKKGPPQPTRESSWAFKSKAPICPPGRPTAAPDVVYCTMINDNGYTKGPVTPRGVVNFEKQTPRPTLYNPQDTPDARTLPSTLNQHSPVRMGQQSPRKGTQTKTASEDVPFYDVENSYRITRPVPLIADFSKNSPRKDINEAAKNQVTTSVEFVEKLCHPEEKRVAASNFALALGRKDPPIYVTDIMYDVEDTQTTYRTRAALVRKDDVGHQPLFEIPITDKCDYKPSLEAARPKLIQNVKMEQQTPRKPQIVQMMDTDYDARRAEQLMVKRVVGNPQIGTHISRDKRNRVMSPKRTTTDAVYTFNTDLFAERGPQGVKMEKQVDRETIFSGRGLPSKKWLAKNPPAPPPGSYDIK